MLLLFLQRLSLENAALLDQAGVDTAGDDELQLLQQQQHQQQQVESGPVTDVPVLSAVEQPLLGAPGQQQQGVGAEAEEEVEEIPLDEEMQDIGMLLKGIADMNQHKDMIGAALTDAGGEGDSACWYMRV